jgi:hypothetical protein
MIHHQLAMDTVRPRQPRRRNLAIDWLAIEHDYRAGDLSLRALGQKHGCAHSTIANFASRHGWPRRTSVSRSC